MNFSKNKKRFTLTPKFFTVGLRSKQGFTLIETLVAISILVIAMMAPLTLATNSLTASFLAKDQIIASFLAEEGIELIKNISSNNVLQGDFWADGFGPGMSDICFNSNGCSVDINLSNPAVCPSGVCPFLKHDPSTKIYSYNSGPDSIFNRKINLIFVTLDENEVEIISSVSWTTGKLSREISIKGNIYNWQCILSSSGC